jgi:tRNA(fMet)-specific endonuclease VapC
MFVLDSDTWTHLFHEHPKVVAKMQQAVLQREIVGIAIITKIEILQGRMAALLKADTHERFLDSQRKLMITEERIQSVRAIPLDEPALLAFDELNNTRGLKKIGRADLLIAIIVRTRQATLVTRNLKHFKRIPQHRCENWVD